MAADIAIAKVVAVASNAFKRKCRPLHARRLYRRELNRLIDDMNTKTLAEVDGIIILRAIIFLGAVYLEKIGKSEMAEEALKGIMPLSEYLKQP